MTPDQVPAWRRAERERLLAERAARPLAARQEEAEALARHLDAVLTARFSGPAGLVVSGYWPIKSEPDLRPWLTALHQQGARIALPVVETRAAPLVFRPWAPGAAMERGHWNILVPADPTHIIPQVTLAPLVGWDRQGYRLGYGGGYFDRTLAALVPRPLVIGVGSQAAEIETIHPQPHDIGLDAIVTGEGVQFLRG